MSLFPPPSITTNITLAKLEIVSKLEKPDKIHNTLRIRLQLEMTVLTSNTKASCVTVDLANGCTVTITTAKSRANIANTTSSAAAEPQEATDFVGKKDIQEATDQQALVLHERESDARLDLTDLAPGDSLDKVTPDDTAPNEGTQAAKEIQPQCANRTATYEDFNSEADVVNKYYMRDKRNALIFPGQNSEEYRAEVARNDARYRQEMAVLIAKYVTVQGFNSEFEKRVVNIELSSRSISDGMLSAVWVVGLVMGMILAWIMGKIFG